MTPQEKYSKIMEVMSDKTLNKGLVYKYKLGTFEMLDSNNSIRIPDGVLHRRYQLFPDIIPIVGSKDYEIIGHPLHIGGVLDWIERNTDKVKFNTIEGLNNHLIILWKNKLLPLSPTDEELIDYIYNLLP